MARKLSGFPAVEAGAAIAENPQAAGGRQYLPYEGADKLPPAKTTEKTRVRDLPDKTTMVTKELIYVKAGEPRYEVRRNHRGEELVAHYAKRGGAGTKHAYTFKTEFQDTPEGRQKRASQESFRARLRAQGVPGA